MTELLPLPPPTPELRRFVAIAGSREAALRLIEARGGTELYIPADGARSGLAAEIGADLVAHLAARHSGNYLTIPVGRTWRIQILRRRGLSTAEIARVLGMSERGVRHSLRTSGMAGSVAPFSPDTQQLDLFSPPGRSSG